MLPRNSNNSKAQSNSLIGYGDSQKRIYLRSGRRKKILSLVYCNENIFLKCDFSY
jgi:hypothetical protein